MARNMYTILSVTWALCKTPLLLLLACCYCIALFCTFQVTIQKGEECFLINNNQPIKWKVSCFTHSIPVQHIIDPWKEVQFFAFNSRQTVSPPGQHHTHGSCAHIQNKGLVLWTPGVLANTAKLEPILQQIFFHWRERTQSLPLALGWHANKIALFWLVVSFLCFR